MKVIAVRHGETEWNKRGLQQGHLDSPLTTLGNAQAKAIAGGLGSHQIDVCYCSDLGRAVETAKHITAAIGQTYILDARLRERNLGLLQGLTKAEFTTKYPTEGQRLTSNDPDYVIPNGESARQRFDRSVNFINELAQKHRDQTVLVVCHGGVLMSYIHQCLSIPLTQKRSYSLYNGSINAFSVAESGQWRLEIWGEVSHLRHYGLEALDDN